jgi:hypothetical protein
MGMNEVCMMTEPNPVFEKNYRDYLRQLDSTQMSRWESVLDISVDEKRRVVQVVFFVNLASTVHAGGLFKKLYFVWLWEGIDDNDGSEAQRSIILNRDGTFKIIGQEPHIIGCNGRGMLTGIGVLEDGIIIVNDFKITCYDDPPSGPYYFIATYKLNALNRTLIEDYPDSDFLPMGLHKISR